MPAIYQFCSLSSGENLAAVGKEIRGRPSLIPSVHDEREVDVCSLKT